MLYPKFIALAIAVSASAAWADTYKCAVGGKVVYTDTPCADSSGASVSASQDKVTARQQTEAQVVNLKNKKQVYEIEAQKHRDKAAQIHQAASAEAEVIRVQSRCNGYAAEVQEARRDLRTYKYHEGIIADAKDREKAYSDKHRAECATW